MKWKMFYIRSGQQRFRTSLKKIVVTTTMKTYYAKHPEDRTFSLWMTATLTMKLKAL